MLNNENIEDRRIPCLVTYIHPFRFISASSSAKWEIDIQKVNSNSYNYTDLHEIVGTIDVGLDFNCKLLVCRDGAIVLPPLPNLQEQQAVVEFFNRCLASMLLGGIYCEAIGLDGLDIGSVIDKKFVRVHTNAQSGTNRFHRAIRMAIASPLDSIELLSPREIRFKDLSRAVSIGRRVMSHIPSLSGEFLLKGVTGYSRGDWGSAVSNLWITVEQITSYLWDEHVVRKAKRDRLFENHAKQLSDVRNWTIALRQELLFQNEIIPPDLYSILNVARKSRNALSHKGEHPNQEAATAALNAVRLLLNIVAQEEKIPFSDLNLSDHAISDPFVPPKTRDLKPEYWMEIKKLPGELELEQLESKQRIAAKDDVDGNETCQTPSHDSDAL